MQIFCVHCLVVPCSVMLSEAVSHVGDSGGPEYVELFLVHAITYPIELHIDGA